MPMRSVPGRDRPNGQDPLDDLVRRAGSRTVRLGRRLLTIEQLVGLVIGVGGLLTLIALAIWLGLS